MTIRFNLSKVALHIGVWMAAFFINIILIQGYSVHINWNNTLISWAFYLFIFYVNYLFLIPRLLHRHRIVWYLLPALAVLAVSFVSIRYTAVESALKSTSNLSDQLQDYQDVKESFDQKERGRERLRELERRIDQSRKQGPPPGRHPMDDRRGPKDGQGPRMLSREALIPPPDSLSFRDSMQFVHMRLMIDSLSAIDYTLTSREEEYGQLRREYERTRSYSRWLAHSDYNPFSRHNLQFIFALIFFYMASIVVYFAEQTTRAEKRRREMEQEKSRAELAYLKQQINPHFLFNTLNSIYSYTIGVSEEASDAVLKLSSILRYMLYETNRDRVPLSDELAVLDNYIDLQRMRTTEKTDIQVLVSGDTHIHRIEPMLLIPIIENAFKYGVDSVEASFVKIEIEVKGSDFTFRVSNKVVRRNEGDKSNSGIGLQNIRRRLELIYGQGNYGMDVKEKDGVFSVILKLNLKG